MTDKIKKHTNGTAVPFSKIVHNNRPGGVTHPDTGFNPETAKRIAVPMLPLNSKKPPIKIFFMLPPEKQSFIKLV